MVERFFCCFGGKSGRFLVIILPYVTFLQYALVNFFMFYKSGHGIIRMFFLHVQAFVRTSNHQTRPDQSELILNIAVQYLLANLFLVCPCQHLVDIQYHHRSTSQRQCGGCPIWHRDSGK